MESMLLKTCLSFHMLSKTKELNQFIVSLYSNVKDYKKFQSVLFIELMKPVKKFIREVCSSDIETKYSSLYDEIETGGN